MTTLIVDRQDTQLTVSAGVLVVRTPDATSDRRLPLKYLQRVVLRAETGLTSKVLSALAAEGISLTVLGGRRGDEIAQITGSAHNDARRRWHQVLFLSQQDNCTRFARRVVLSKVKKQLVALTHLSKLRPDLRKPMFDGQRQLAAILANAASSQQTQGHTLAGLRGIEGAAACAYFGSYFTAFAPALGATGRNRRPPRDPVNAVLSLSYTMLHSEATAACWTAGLDPAIGALHSLSHGRAALACDLMEPLRPVVDLWVWKMFRDGLLRPEHFGHDGAGHCLLGKAGRAAFYPAWHEQQLAIGRHLLRYARSAAQAFVSADIPDHWTELEKQVEG